MFIIWARGPSIDYTSSGREQEELSSLLSIVGNTSLTNDDMDGWRCSMESSGAYSVKSLRDDLDEKNSPTNKVVFPCS